jgi:ethanolamine utilization protein EutA (predicted chaperonin)
MDEAPGILKMGREINHMLGAPDIDKEKLKVAILSLAAEKYKNIGSSPSISEMLKAEFEKSNPLFAFDRQLFGKAVGSVLIGDGGDISLALKNGNVIGRCGQYAANVRNSTGKRADRQENTA